VKPRLEWVSLASGPVEAERGHAIGCDSHIGESFVA